MPTWDYVANRPLQVGNTSRQSWLGEKDNVLYLLHEPDNYYTPDDHRFFKWDGSWVELEHLPALPTDGEHKPPEGHHYTYLYYLRDVQAYVLGDGRFAWVGVQWRLFQDSWTDQLQYIGCTLHETKWRPIVHIYDVALDSWTQYVGDTWYGGVWWSDTYVTNVDVMPQGAVCYDEVNGCAYIACESSILRWQEDDNSFEAPFSLPGMLSQSYQQGVWQDRGWLSVLEDGEVYCLAWSGGAKVFQLQVGDFWSVTTITATPCKGESVSYWSHHHAGIGNALWFDHNYYSYTAPAYRFYRKTTINTEDLVEPSFPYPPVWGINFLVAAHGIWCVNPNCVYKYSGSEDMTPPTCAITDPEQSETVGGLVDVQGTAADDVGLSKVKLYVDGSYVGEMAVSGTSANWSALWNTTLWADGSHQLRACAIDTSGNTGWSAIITVTVDNTGPQPDTEPPVVEITEPEDAAEVAGITTISAHCTDNQALAKARLYVGGTQQGGDLVISGQEATATWQFDFSGWANGTYTVTVAAEDASGNIGTDSIQVTVNNLYATEPKYLYTKEQPLDADAWALGDAGEVSLQQMVCVQTGMLPTEPKQLYNCYVGFRTSTGGAIAADFDAMTQIPVNRAVAMPNDATKVRWGIKAVPAFREVVWAEPSYKEFFRIIAADDRWYLLSRGPCAVWRYENGILTAMANLETQMGIGTLYEGCYLDSKLYIGTDLGLLVFDLDAQEEPQLIQLNKDNPATKALATDGEYVMAVQNGVLYRYKFEQVSIDSDSTPSGPIHITDGNVLLAGTQEASDNAVYRYSPGGEYLGNWTLVGAVAEGYVHRLWSENLDSTVYVWVGCVESIYVTQPAWARDQLFDSGNVLAFADWLGYQWAAGTIGGLWRKTSSGWQQYDLLTGVTAVYDMAVIDGLLFLACSYDGEGGAEARLLAFAVDEGGSFQCGPIPPDVLCRMLTYAAVTE